MRASMTVTGINSTMVALRRLEERTSKRSLRRAEKGANDIKRLAALLTPYRTGDLQNSIRVKEKQTGSGRAWRRKEWTVGVDTALLDLQKRKGFPYHRLMHDEHYNLGPGSLLKSARVSVPAGVKRGSGSSVIGRYYLKRAVDFHEKQIIKDINAIVASEARSF